MDADERHDDWDDSLWECVECGTWHDAGDDFTRTDCGPVCSNCTLPIAGVVA